jgi:hypothetical protein
MRFGSRADRCRVNSDAGRSGDGSDALRSRHPRVRAVEQGGFVSACGSGARASIRRRVTSVQILGFELPVHAISIKSECSDLLEQWLDTEILPLYDRHAELARQSLNRKIGALRLGVEAALKIATEALGAWRTTPAGIDVSSLRALETELRTAAGKIAQARTECLDRPTRFASVRMALIRTAANNLIDAWDSGASCNGRRPHQKHAGTGWCGGRRGSASAIQEVAGNAGSVLAKTAMALETREQAGAG